MSPLWASQRDSDDWEEEIRRAQKTLADVGEDRARLIVSFVMNSFLFFAYPLTYGTRAYHPLRAEVLKQAVLHPRSTVYELAKYACDARYGKKVGLKFASDVPAQTLNYYLFPRSPLCFQIKCRDEQGQPLRIYPTIFLVRFIQEMALGTLLKEQMNECARITDAGKVLLVQDDRGPYPRKWHYPCSLIREGEEVGDAARRVGKRLFKGELRLEGLLYERPSTQRLVSGELEWNRIFESYVPEELVSASSAPLRWWTEEEIRRDLNSEAKHEIEDLHAQIELRMRDIHGTHWKNTGKLSERIFWHST